MKLVISKSQMLVTANILVKIFSCAYHMFKYAVCLYSLFLLKEKVLYQYVQCYQALHQVKPNPCSLFTSKLLEF